MREEHTAVSPCRHGRSSSQFAIYGFDPLHPPAWLTISSTRLTPVMKPRDNNQRLQSSTHLEQSSSDYNKKCQLQCYSTHTHTHPRQQEMSTMWEYLYMLWCQTTLNIFLQQMYISSRSCVWKSSPIFSETLTCLFATSAWQDGHQRLYQSHRVQRSTCYDGFNQAYSTKTAIRDCWHSSIKSENYTYKQLQSTYLRVVSCCSM